MPGVFISYRRIDSAGFAGRLFDHLSRTFGRNRVFMDNEGSIERGADFPAVIEQAVQASDAMIVVIGRQWLTCVDVEGQQRLSKPDDWVRNEIALALRRDILLLPVLVDGAAMPSPEQLPENLHHLARKQASEITSTRWDYDVGQVVKTLERTMTPNPTAVPPTRNKILWAAALAIVVALAAGYYSFKETGLSTPTVDAPLAKLDAQDLRGFWRDDDGKLYKIVQRDGGDFDMGRIDPPETDPVYRVVHVKDRSIEIAIGVLPSGTQQAVANLELSVDGNVMAGLLKSTQIEDTPQNWVLRRTSGEPATLNQPRKSTP